MCPCNKSSFTTRATKTGQKRDEILQPPGNFLVLLGQGVIPVAEVAILEVEPEEEKELCLSRLRPNCNAIVIFFIYLLYKAKLVYRLKADFIHFYTIHHLNLRLQTYSTWGNVNT